VKLTTKCRYGVRAVLEIAKNYDNRPTTRKEISKNQNIPESFLENILLELKRAGLVLSVRGAKGGFLLNRTPNSISMLDIVLILQNSIVPVECVLNPMKCAKVAKCKTRPIWKKMHEAQENVLQSYSVKSLLENKEIDQDCLLI
jgi:Rrf2 family transcriptional regulator, cysteine metabolism repressor